MTDNARGAWNAKIDMRRAVLDQVRPASVFDAFCGLGEIWRKVWREADRYVGCDAREWSPAEPHRRFVADNRLVLRHLNLQQFNVFDLDAYGSPWEQAAIIAARRKWAPGERGALLLTDGSSMKLRFGGVPHAIAWLLGMTVERLIPTLGSADVMQELATKAWVRRANVRLIRHLRADGRGSGRGGQTMIYQALIFEGQPTNGN